LGTSLAGIGFGLGDLGELGTLVGASILTTSREDPSEAIDPPTLAFLAGADMKLLMSY